MKKKNRSSIIIIIIIVLVCIGCAILSGTPYFKNKMAKLTQKEHFEGTACLGGPTGSYLQGPGGVKDCYTLEGKKNSVPENFFKKPIFFDNASLHLQNNLDENNQLHTSITNEQDKLNFTLNKTDSNFDIVRSPKLTPQTYASYDTPPPKRTETISSTTTSTEQGFRDEDRFDIVQTKGKQECDGSIKSIFNKIATTVKTAFQSETTKTTSTTRQIEDTPSQGWKPPQPFKLPQNVGNDNFPAKDESSDKLVHRFGSDGSSISTGVIRTLGGVKFNNNSSITQDSNKNLEIYADNQISFSTSPTNQPIKTLVNENSSVPTIHLGTKQSRAKNYLTKDDVRNLNKIIDGSEPLILNKLRCGDITTPSIESDMFYGQNIVSGELNVFKDQNKRVDPIQFRATQNASKHHKNYMVITNNNSNTQIKSTANLTFGGQGLNSFIKLNDNDHVSSLTADIINGQQPCAIENNHVPNKFLHINYDHTETDWKQFDTLQPLFHNALYEIKLVKRVVTKSGTETVTLYSGTSGNPPYMPRIHKKLIPINTRGNLDYYLVEMGIFSQSDIRRLSFMDKITTVPTQRLSNNIQITVYYKKVSHNYATDMLGKTPFYINVAQSKASSSPT